MRASSVDMSLISFCILASRAFSFCLHLMAASRFLTALKFLLASASLVDLPTWVDSELVFPEWGDCDSSGDAFLPLALSAALLLLLLVILGVFVVFAFSRLLLLLELAAARPNELDELSFLIFEFGWPAVAAEAFEFLALGANGAFLFAVVAAPDPSVFPLGVIRDTGANSRRFRFVPVG